MTAVNKNSDLKFLALFSVLAVVALGTQAPLHVQGYSGNNNVFVSSNSSCPGFGLITWTNVYSTLESYSYTNGRIANQWGWQNNAMTSSAYYWDYYQVVMFVDGSGSHLALQILNQKGVNAYIPPLVGSTSFYIGTGNSILISGIDPYSNGHAKDATWNVYYPNVYTLVINGYLAFNSTFQNPIQTYSPVFVSDAGNKPVQFYSGYGQQTYLQSSISQNSCNEIFTGENSNMQYGNNLICTSQNCTQSFNYPGGNVAYWPFNEGSGSSAYNYYTYYTGTTYTATLYNSPAWQSGSSCARGFGTCLQFSTSRVSYAGIGKSLSGFEIGGTGNAPLTFSTWYYLPSIDSGNDGWPMIFGDTYGSTRNGYDMFVTTGSSGVGAGKIGFERFVGGSNAQIFSPTLSVGWHLLTGTYNGVTLALFVDGSEVGSVTNTASMVNPSGNFFFMASGPSSNVGYGTLEDFGFYNYALSGSQISQLYNTQVQS